MKTTTILILLISCCLSLGYAQEGPLEAIKSSLGEEQVSTAVLYPLDIEGVKVTDIKVDYRFPFEEGKSDLIISMDEFKSLESAVFDLEEIDRSKLLKAFDQFSSKGFTVAFQKDSPSNFCRLITNNQNPEEAYLLVGNQKKAELLGISYPKDSKKLTESLKIKLETILN
ncbi:hypothetical protein [Algoriphagus confluentis]|uniref:DUF4252 domain-containing protein n=1 Tax=Algoriphagus confluentis TaxID=1697556 RepID=A0ABQ6PLL4_9BACT|nr:hypothetical protein Aconfl_14820 [Algoriphagus confluentis]